MFNYFIQFSPGFGRLVNKWISNGINNDLTTDIFLICVSFLLLKFCFIFILKHWSKFDSINLIRLTSMLYPRVKIEYLPITISILSWWNLYYIFFGSYRNNLWLIRIHFRPEIKPNRSIISKTVFVITHPIHLKVKKCHPHIVIVYILIPLY